jgi:hypothetical protein
MNLRDSLQIVKGIATYVPGVVGALQKRGTGGTDKAQYCYGIWLKHLTLAASCGAFERIPDRIAEIGPGDSLGVGVAALLSGASEYHALDVVRYSNTERTLEILDELVRLFQGRAARPTKGWPDFDDLLDERLFPGAVLGEDWLRKCLDAERIAAIKAAIGEPGKRCDGILVDYQVPWVHPHVIRAGELDYILSHSVLEHVLDLGLTYASMHRWLKAGGVMSHQIDFTSHGITREWNGHRKFSELAWKLILGRRSFLINREPYGTHVKLLEKNGFAPLLSLNNFDTKGLDRNQYARRWRSLDDVDANTMSAFYVARVTEAVQGAGGMERAGVCRSRLAGEAE